MMSEFEIIELRSKQRIIQTVSSLLTSFIMGIMFSDVLKVILGDSKITVMVIVLIVSAIVISLSAYGFMILKRLQILQDEKFAKICAALENE